MNNNDPKEKRGWRKVTDSRPDDPKVKIAGRIRAAHELLIWIGKDLRCMDDFDHAQDMSNAALYCRAAANELLGIAPEKRAKRARRKAKS